MSERYPDFIIGGAPKCGTTSLHFILDQHPDIALPEDEVHFFDADDPITHPDFLHGDGAGLRRYDPEDAAFRARYAAKFAPFAGAGLIGEDSTTYLLSPVAAARIRALLPEARLIFMLRDPVARAWSQYWHEVTRARATTRFETALRRHPGLVLGSTYREPLRRFLDIFGAERIKVVLFEDFIADQQRILDEVTDFLGAARMEVRPDRAWFNRTAYPVSLGAQLALNRIGRRIVALRYRSHLEPGAGLRSRMANRLHYHWFRRINPILLKAPKPPPMAPETRIWLAAHFSRRNEGLSADLGRDLSAVWPGFQG